MRTLKMIPAVLVVMMASNVFASSNLPCNQKSPASIKADTNPKVATKSSTAHGTTTKGIK